MLDLAEKRPAAFVLVSHDEQLAARCARMLRLVRGGRGCQGVPDAFPMRGVLACPP